MVVLLLSALLAARLIDRVRVDRPSEAATSKQADSPKMADRAPKLISPVDYNHNGVDDYSDIVAGTRQDAEHHPHYDSGYYQGGYPPADRGACTDLVWPSLRTAGYDLKAMVDADIASHPDAYSAAISRPDPNIDFRRASVLGIFLGRYGQTLTNDTADHDQWGQADLVVFDNGWHIGVVSDRRDQSGVPLLLHNMGQKERENDYLNSPKRRPITGHYRFDASKVPADVLKAWTS
ncbi:DUF1287 domain-containing protein [Bifidobacterium aemilianum]|uniref:DUF1287 domain-containing protein n=2 Tax=Bifidobacterium aemilianum TaxID=2493120 RepID=A0A366K7L2_9BIFI|nr:DUF1287 domain-containing protein [Bifidobacterium aemilianum]